MFKKITCFFLLSICFIFADDRTFLSGKLQNGLSYYVKENNNPENHLSIRLVVKVGSAVETEKERGIAHLVEHMVFRGTQAFDDWAVIDYMNSIGAEFGPCVNAYTASQCTTFEFDIPDCSEEILNNVLLIFSDFAFHATLDDKKIEAEKKIVINELHMRYSGARYEEALHHHQNLFKDTALENKDPINIDELIKNTPTWVVKNFYHKWYRPELMAVIVVGNVNKEKAVAAISDCFSITTQALSYDMPVYNFVKNYDNIVSIFSNSQLTKYDLCVGKMKYEANNNTEDFIKRKLFLQFTMLALDERLRELQIDDVPFSFAHTTWFYEHGLEDFEIEMECNENKVLDSLKIAVEEFQNLQCKGLSKSEFMIAKNYLINDVNSTLANINKLENKIFADYYVDVFNDNAPFISLENRYKLEQQILSDLSLEEIDFLSSQFFKDNKWFVCVSTPITSEKIDQETVQSTIDNVSIATIRDNKHADEQMIDVPDAPGKIVSMQKDEKLGTAEVLLDNGMKVILKPTNFKKNEILMCSCANKGRVFIPDDLVMTSRLATEYALYSGMGDLTYSDWQYIFDKNGINFEVNFDGAYREISATSPSSNVEVALKAYYNFFTNKNFDDGLWEDIVDELKKYPEEESKIKEDLFESWILDKVLLGSSLIKKTDFNLLKEQDAKNIAEQCFSNPEEFTTILVGDFKVEDILPLIEKYLGGIPECHPNFFKFKNDLQDLAFPKGYTYDVFGKQEGQNNTVVLAVDASLQAVDNTLGPTMDIMEKIVATRLLKTLRRDASLSYSVNCRLLYPFFPYASLGYLICEIICDKDINPQTIASMAKIELEKIASDQVDISEFNAAKEIIKKNRRILATGNHFWLTSLADKVLTGRNISTNFKERLNLVRPEDVVKLASNIMNNGNYRVLAWTE